MSSCFIIAEVGVNHNGSIELAKQLIDVAITAKVDAVKFQTFKAESLVTQNANKTAYQMRNIGDEDHSQLNMLKALELSYPDHFILKEYAEKKGIEFLSTPFDLESLHFLVNDLKLKKIKVSSADIDNAPLLYALAKAQIEIILSTGMSTLQEIEQALSLLSPRQKVTLLHCVSQYPAPYEAINLKAIQTLKQTFDLEIGYSDHSLGAEISIAAVALGATVIEKHITLDQNLPGPDHKASMEPNDFCAMVQAIRHIEQAMGDGIKVPHAVELETMKQARRSIVAKQNIRAGELFSEENLTVKRPSGGLSPILYKELLGKKANRDYQMDEMIVL